MYRITICQTTGMSGSVVVTRTVHTFTAPRVPATIDQIVEDWEGDFYTVEDDDGLD